MLANRIREERIEKLSGAIDIIVEFEDGDNHFLKEAINEEIDRLIDEQEE